MKISQAQKLKNRKKIIESAVGLFAQKGFKETTMKEIAKAAKLSEPAIYNYFPTKEGLVYAFFEEEFTNTLTELQQQKSFDALKLTEKVQALLESHFERLQKNRQFVEDTFKSIFVTDLPSSSTAISKHRSLFISFFQAQMKRSQEKGELQTSSFDDFFANVFWDFYIGMVYYWLKDQSPSYANTSQLLDKTLMLMEEFMQTKILSRVLDILQFFIRQHLFEGISSLFTLDKGFASGKKENH